MPPRAPLQTGRRTRAGAAGEAAPPPGKTDGARWSLFGRAVFRFSVVYLGLFMLATQVAGSLFLVPGIPFRGLGRLWPMREISVWVARQAFGAVPPIDVTPANGEMIFFLAQMSWMLVVGAALAGLWSLLARPRDSEVHRWFRLFVRFGLAAQMFEYGITKIIPNQFAAPALSTLTTPAGDLSLNTVFWTAVGSAPGYQMFTGWAELLAGVLLVVPRTTMLGALICLVDMVHVLALNLAFDIGLKLTSVHLVLLALFLLAPDASRLVDFLVRDRPPGPAAPRTLFTTRRANRVALAVQVVFALYLVGMQTSANVAFWYREGGGAPRSPLYGVWDVEALAVNGEVGPPALNDYDRQWRRVIFDRPDRIIFQRLDDSFARYGASLDLPGSQLVLTKGNSRTWRSAFTLERPAPDRLVLDGEMDAQRIHLQLRLVELDSFRLLSSDFRWIRPG